MIFIYSDNHICPFKFQILERIDAPNFQRPERPHHCPMEIYKIMKNHCWNDSPEERASFEVLERMILEVCDFRNERRYFVAEKQFRYLLKSMDKAEGQITSQISVRDFYDFKITWFRL